MAIGGLGMTAGVLLKTTGIFKPAAVNGPSQLIASAKRSDYGGWVQIGHLVYTVLAARLLPESGGRDASHFLLRVSVRIADIQGVSDYIDNETFRLLVDGAALSHSNNVSVTVDEKSAAQAELVFELPERISKAELMVGRPSEGVARIPLELIPHRIADGS